IVGKTPLDKPLNVSIGRRKITATKQGETAQTKNVEIAAGETAKVEITSSPAKEGGGATNPNADAGTTPPGEEGGGSSTLLTVGWIGTAALATGTIITGILAASKASALKDARNAFPGNKADIDSKASSTTTLAIVTDVLGASTLVLGG